MAGYLHLFIEGKNSVGTIFGADATMYADHRFIDFTIPENGIDHAGVLAIAATDAFRLIKANPSSLARQECIGRTNLQTGRVLAGTADHHHETSFHAAGRFDANAGLGEARFVLSQRTGKHTDLTSNTSFGVQHY
jgi:hypothetical protein